MAVSDNQKIDYVWKKLGYGRTKTDTATKKEGYNESIPSPLLIRGDTIWQDAASIPQSAPGSTTTIVEVLSNFNSVECTPDLTTPYNSNTTYASWKTLSGDWIDPTFSPNDASYQVKVFVDNAGAANPFVTGTPVNAIQYPWFFDYQSGVLNFNGSLPGELPPSLTSGKKIYVMGCRYIGNKGSVTWDSTYTTVYANSASWGTGGSGGANLSEIAAVSGNWNSTYTSVCATSANWDEVYTAVTTYSASWNEGGTGASVDLSALAAASGNWNSTYTSLCTVSALYDSTYTSLCTVSANWDEVYTAVTTYSASWNEGGTGASVDLSALAAASGNWNSTYTSLCTVSALYDSVYITVSTLSASWEESAEIEADLANIAAVSADWNSTYTSLCTVSANYDSVYSTVQANSASWEESAEIEADLANIASASGNWNSTYTSLCTVSANYDSVYITVSTLSASWDDLSDLSALASASGNWNSTYTSLCTVSANYDSVYSTVQANSASWEESAEIEADLANIAAVSADWNSTYTSLCTVSANYDSVYSSVQANSASWNYGGSVDLSSIAAVSADWNSTYTSLCTVSALYDSTYTSLCTVSANYDSVYSTVQANSASWEESAEIEADLANIAAASGNWNSTYTSLCTVSANYDSVYSSVKTSSANWNTAYNSITNDINPVSSYWARTDQNTLFMQNLSVGGSLTVTGSATFTNTLFTTTTAISVVNTGPGPALYIYQASGPYDIASFYDGDGVEVLHVGNAQGGGDPRGKIGINVSDPTVELTVNGQISANDIITVSGGNSNLWNSTYTSLCTVSALYDSVYSTVKANSASWEESAEIEADLANIASVSSNWNSTYTSLCTVSALYDSVYSTVKANSASWEESAEIEADLANIASVSSNWNSTYTSLCTVSANYDSVYSSVQTNSASWNYGGSVDLSSIAAVSSNWNSTYTSLCTVSANYDSVYITVSTLSASWDDLSDLSALASASGNWNSTYTSLCTVSALYDSVYSTVKANSASWEESAEIEADLANIAAVSSNWNSTYTSLCTVSALYDSVYSTVKANSASWEESAEIEADLANIASVSSNWNSTYTSLCTVSANYNSVYSTVQTNSANYILDGGNTKNANIVIGTNDSYSFSIKANNNNYVTIEQVGNEGCFATSSKANQIGGGTATPAQQGGTGSPYGYAITLGAGTANGYNSIAFANGSATGSGSVAGKSGQASGIGSLAIGAQSNTIASGNYSFAIGSGVVARGANSIALGTYAETPYAQSFAWGSIPVNEYAIIPAVSSTRTGQFMVSAVGGVFFPGNVGIGTDNKDNALTVAGLISTDSYNTSIEWNSTYTSLCTVSALYDSVYSTVKANSASWEESAEIEADLANIASVSSNWNSTYTSLCTVSASYDSVYSSVQANSASWNYGGSVDLSSIAAVSSNWNSTYTSLCTVSANYDSVYTTLCTVSANILYTDWAIPALPIPDIILSTAFFPDGLNKTMLIPYLSGVNDFTNNIDTLGINNTQLKFRNCPFFTTKGLTQELLNKYEIFIEMVTYRTKKSKRAVPYPGGPAICTTYESKYSTHSSSLVKPWGSNFWTRSQDTRFNIEIDNQIPVTSLNERICLSGCLTSRFRAASAKYVDLDIIETPPYFKRLQVVIPVGNAIQSENSNTLPTTRMGYSVYKPTYVAFRYIAWLPQANNGLGQIVEGPLSPPIRIVNSRWPFYIDHYNSSVYNKTVLTINPSFDREEFKCKFV